MPRCLIGQWMPLSPRFIRKSDEIRNWRRLWDPLFRHLYKRLTVRTFGPFWANWLCRYVNHWFFPAFSVICEIIIVLIWDEYSLAWDQLSEKWTLGDWELISTPTRICKPKYWMQLVNSTEHLLTQQMAPDFMIWDQRSRDNFHAWYVKILTEFFLILLWTLWSYAHLLQRLFFFLVCYYWFFFCLWWLYTTQERILKQKSTYLCSCSPYSVLYWFPPQFQYLLIQHLLYRALSLSVYCSERHTASCLRKSQVSQPGRVFVLLIA